GSATSCPSPPRARLRPRCRRAPAPPARRRAGTTSTWSRTSTERTRVTDVATDERRERASLGASQAQPLSREGPLPSLVLCLLAGTTPSSASPAKGILGKSGFGRPSRLAGSAGCAPQQLLGALAGVALHGVPGALGAAVPTVPAGVEEGGGGRTRPVAGEQLGRQVRVDEGEAAPGLDELDLGDEGLLVGLDGALGEVLGELQVLVAHLRQVPRG